MRRSTSLMCACVCLLFWSICLAAAQAPDYHFVQKWGSYGTGNGEFNSPYALATDAYGNVYVADTLNHRIQKFDSNGVFLTTWGSLGSGDGQFASPLGVATWTDVGGNVFVYVSDKDNHCIQKFDGNGTFLGKWGSLGYDDGQFYEPSGVATDADGNVYVAELWGFRIQKFDSDGTFLTKWGSFGGAPGFLLWPYGLATDLSGNVYVTEWWYNRIQKFSSEGVFLEAYDSYGSGDGQFIENHGVAVDLVGNVFTADSGNDRIQEFDSDWNFLTKWGSSGSGDGEFAQPNGVATDRAGNVYVADTLNHRIQKFTPGLVVDIDIKPGAYPNSINLGSNGVIPVAILSSDAFDATQVDPDTVALAGAEVAIRGKGSTYMAHHEDVNGDGLMDLLVQVVTENLDAGQFQYGFAELTGTLYLEYGGTAIYGLDEITIVPPE